MHVHQSATSILHRSRNKNILHESISLSCHLLRIDFVIHLRNLTLLSILLISPISVKGFLVNCTTFYHFYRATQLC